jgi:large subunit ribosomal protein L15
MNLHELKSKTERKHHQRIGRGGKRGTTSGRGTKGQRSRSGHKIRPAIRDLMMKIPKRRGANFKSFSGAFVIINLSALESNFSSGAKVTPRTLSEKGLVKFKKGALPKVKVLDEGKLTKKLILENLYVSESAAKKIMALGGEVRQSAK